MEDKGTLIVLAPVRFTVANPEHVELARRACERLARAGLMQPVAPDRPRHRIPPPPQ
ncbi:Imm52 family immunity protein [Corallococcus exercitus]|uniref:Imm52 family immunity protein n=1 Tax=Corallococcus exercitus TaxID=2316736 RepID=UPI0035D4A07A